MRTKENTTKSAKISMFIFILHFTKINLIASIKNEFFPMFKMLALIGLWTLPVIINCNTICNTKFNMYYILISVIAMLLGIVINGVRGDMQHAVYLDSEKCNLSAYYRLLVKLNNKLYYR